jgi:hypothetical protein
LHEQEIAGRQEGRGDAQQGQIAQREASKVTASAVARVMMIDGID